MGKLAARVTSWIAVRVTEPAAMKLSTPPLAVRGESRDQEETEEKEKTEQTELP